MIKENAPSKVKELTTMAYSQLPNVKKSIETLKALKAVGPATASGNLDHTHFSYYNNYN